jgi:succinate dehydrogenase / fumarate reductase, cytochrome b subunit
VTIASAAKPGAAGRHRNEALMTTTTSANPATPAPRNSSSRRRPLRRTLYRGDPAMWSWLLHRITGATIFFFLFVHVLDTALVRVSPQTYDEVISTYKTPIVGLMELGLVAAVLYHALNGVRVILIDFWAQGTRYQRLMLWAIAVIWLLVMVPATVVVGIHMIGHFR